MNNGVVQLHLGQMASAYIFVVILLFIVRKRGIPREKEILISSFRMTIQLVLTGYVLTFLFEASHPLYTLLAITVMESFAIYNVYNRSKLNLNRRIKVAIALSLLFGTLIGLFYFILVVVRIKPWYEPRYFISLAGMIIGNSMTGVALAVNRLVDGMNTQKNMVEAALMLGATPQAATKTIVDNAFDSAILPTINNMVGMGIVFLPGMMTGQILSGTAPTTAIRYQIAIMLGILGSVTLAVILFVQFGYKTFFNEHSQMVHDLSDGA